MLNMPEEFVKKPIKILSAVIVANLYVFCKKTLFKLCDERLILTPNLSSSVI